MATRPIPEIGAEFGPYRLETILGRGGMGVVFRAEDLRLGRQVALKLLPAELGDDAAFRSRFLRESRMAASINHPGVIPVFEAGDVEGRLYIAMRWVEGTDLAALLRSEGRLDAARAVALVGQLADALDAAHGRGLVHRDVKPSNVLVALEGSAEHAYLGDFGITKDSSASGTLTDSGELLGTVSYMAPEVIRGEQPDGRADLYSLGCVLFECLIGVAPFVGRSEAAVLYAHLEAPRPKPSDIRPDLPHAFDGVVTRAMAKRPDDRWPTGADMAAAAHLALGGEHAARGSAIRAIPRRLAIATLGLVIATGVGLAAVLHRSGGGKLEPSRADGVTVIDPDKQSITAKVLVPAPSEVVAGAGAVWVTSEDSGTVSRLDASTRTVRQTIHTPSGPGAIAVDSKGVWAVNSLSGTVSRISPTTNEVVATVPVGNDPTGICLGGGSVWVANRADRTLWRLDPSSGHRVGSTTLDAPPTSLACSGTAVWASSEEAGTVTQVDPGGRVSGTVDVGRGASGIAVSAGSVWVANTLDGTVSRIDAKRGVVVGTVPVGSGPARVAAGPRAVWVSNELDGTIVRIDPARGVVTERLGVGARPQGLAVVGGALWVGVRASSGHRGGTLSLLAHERFDRGNFDPATAYSFLTWEVLRLTNDGLTAWRRTGGRRGAEVVPDLAVSLPVPSDSGRTYRFQLRRGVRYSTGAAVRPSDVRHGIERALRQGSVAGNFLGAIAGASSCSARACDLSRGIVVDDGAETITFHLRAADPDFLAKLALPFAVAVPPSVGKPNRVVPATGPYTVAELKPNRLLRLARNPHFHVWSTAARPDGFADTIRLQSGVPSPGALLAVQRGRADWLEGFLAHVSRASVASLFRNNPALVHSNVQAATTYVALNTQVHPFDDVRVRRALSFAIDRDAAVEADGGSHFAAPTCQMVPPNFLSYRRYCPYTAGGGNPVGGWRGPDLVRARRLVARSHTKGMRVTIPVPNNLVSEGRLVQRPLQRLGYRARLKVLPTDSFYPYVSDSRHDVQAAVNTWYVDYPAASDFLELLFSCRAFRPASPENLNWSRSCDPIMERLMRRAARLQPSKPEQANALWARADRRLVDQAAAVPLTNPVNVDVVSPRVGNYQFNPAADGILFDQLWVR